MRNARDEAVRKAPSAIPIRRPLRKAQDAMKANPTVLSRAFHQRTVGTGKNHRTAPVT